MELRQLEIFRVLAHELNFTRTAERVHCVQSNVTVQIRGLEAELGVALFERLGKKVRLTDDGRRFMPYAERVLDLLTEAKASLSACEDPRGTLRLAAPESVLTYRLPPMLQALRENYPAIELSFVPQVCSKLWEALEHGDVDMVFGIDDLPVHQRINVRGLGRECMVLLASAKHALSSLKHVRPEDLAGQSLLLTEDGCTYRQKLEDLLAAAGVRPGAVHSFTSIEAIKQCAALGLGVAHLPLMAAEAELAEGSLLALPWRGPSLDMHTFVAWHKDRWQSPAMRAFLSLLPK